MAQARMKAIVAEFSFRKSADPVATPLLPFVRFRTPRAQAQQAAIHASFAGLVARS